MCLLLKQIVDVLNVVERIVDEELEFWDDAKLMTFEIAESKANLACLCIDVLKQFLSLVGWEDAEVCLSYREVWTYAYHAH